MIWNYILSIKVNDNVIYKKDTHEKKTTILNHDKKLLDKNSIDCEILSNMEVLKYARKC